MPTLPAAASPFPPFPLHPILIHLGRATQQERRHGGTNAENHSLCDDFGPHDNGTLGDDYPGYWRAGRHPDYSYRNGANRSGGSIDNAPPTPGYGSVSSHASPPPGPDGHIGDCGENDDVDGEGKSSKTSRF